MDQRSALTIRYFILLDVDHLLGIECDEPGSSESSGNRCAPAISYDLLERRPAVEAIVEPASALLAGA
jgi:hypothetical protein